MLVPAIVRPERHLVASGASARGSMTNENGRSGYGQASR